jgi:tetratricopeptide (TPR) repeat protein
MQHDHSSRLEQATQLYQSGKYRAAAEIAQEIISRDQNHRGAHLLLGIVCAKSERYDEAEEHLTQVLASAPDDRDALIWLSVTKKAKEEFEEAVLLAQRAIAILPDASSYNALGMCLLSMREPKRAIVAFQDALRSDPSSAPAHHNLGLALRMDERRFEALEALKKALELAPENPGNWLEVCEQLQRLSRWTDAVRVGEQALQKFPNSIAFYIFLANAYSVLKQPEAAERMFQRGMEVNPSTSQSYAQWLVEEGRFADSLNCLAQSIRSRPIQGYAYYCLAESKRFEIDGQSWVETAEGHYHHPSLRMKDRMFLDYALGIAYEKQKDFGKAMHHFDRGCQAAFRIYNAGRPFSEAAGRATTDRHIETFSAESIASLKAHGSSDITPIFIVGMIRSGTTLLEQIVSSHRDVKAAGELVFWIIEADRVNRKWRANGVDPGDLSKLASDYRLVLETMAGQSPRITDKMPLNYEHLGLIHAAFPKAKILHIRRNPLDTCLSVYTTHYGPGPNFAYRQDHIVTYYMAYLRLMEHWRKVLPAEQFFELDYEELIASREATTHQIIDFLELPWDDSCLHHENNTNAINTPSRWQARQPIYTTSVEKWRNYEPHLGDLLKLKDITHPAPNRPSLLK